MVKLGEILLFRLNSGWFVGNTISGDSNKITWECWTEQHQICNDTEDFLFYLEPVQHHLHHSISRLPCVFFLVLTILVQSPSTNLLFVVWVSFPMAISQSQDAFHRDWGSPPEDVEEALKEHFVETWKPSCRHLFRLQRRFFTYSLS